MSARGPAVAVALAAVAVVGCSRGPSSEERGRRRDAGPPVVVVDDPGKLTAVAPEVEPNDDPASPARLEVPGGVAATLGEGDVDRFALLVPRDGPVAVRVEPSAGLDVVVELSDEQGAVLARSDRSGPGSLEGLPNFPVAKGQRVVVSVSRFVKRAKAAKGGKGGKPDRPAAAAPAAAPVGPGYRLVVELGSPRDGAEREPNDDLTAARELVVGGEATGFLGWAKDLDVWTVSLAGVAADDGLDVSIDGVEGVAITAELVGDGAPLAVRRGGKGEGVAIRGLAGATGTHLVLRLSGTTSNPEAPYHVRAASRGLGPDEEREPNDDEDHATAVLLGGASEQGRVRGFLDGGDRDVWRISAGESVVASVWVTPPAGADLALRVGSAGGRELARVDANRHGGAERLDELGVQSGKDLFVEVTGAAPGDLAEGYVLDWSYFPGVPQPASPLEPEPSE